ncbi:MAG: ABC transporter substrate-binding protein [Actinobacteria bacterium]|nr:ABC transporter substrate-binding protein [Actinomycetota bacterium]
MSTVTPTLWGAGKQTSAAPMFEIFGGTIMNTALRIVGRRSMTRFTLGAGLAAIALLASACSSDSTSAPASSATSATTADTATDGTGTASTATGGTELGPATGEKLLIGLVNTEGTPGIDFPDIRKDIVATTDYLNAHGGFGGRPIEYVPCIAKGTPESSQACAQELVGKKVDLILLGLDLFPDYKTYTSASIPVIGVLPILPPDYNADALFITGGNATVMSAAAVVARDHFKAKTVSIISSSNAGSAQSASAVKASLDVAGIKSKLVTGGDGETDAGFQGLMREAAKDNPDVIISLYADSGCIGSMRGRAALGITIPVITTGICSSKEVLKEVGDDAVGWVFAGVNESVDSPQRTIMRARSAPSCARSSPRCSAFLRPKSTSTVLVLERWAT